MPEGAQPNREKQGEAPHVTKRRPLQAEGASKYSSGKDNSSAARLSRAVPARGICHAPCDAQLCQASRESSMPEGAQLNREKRGEAP